MTHQMLSAVTLVLLLPCAATAEPSKLWGDNGEVFEPQQPIADFSYAGYHRGEAPLPDREPDVSVIDFGAKPDDDTDDTAAFRKALREAGGNCIAVPAGRYVLSDRLVIDESGTVLKGAGAGETTLAFTRSLEEIEPRRSMTGHGTPTTAWAWSGGLIRIGGHGSAGTDPTAKLAEAAPRGSQILHLVDNPYKAGDEVVVDAREIDDGSLASYLYRGEVRDSDTDINRLRVRLIARVASVDGDRLRLDRPLRFDARPEWVTVSRFAPEVVESGIEGVTIEFPNTPYRGHFNEDGYNGLDLTNAAHCWVRDVEVINPDSGVFMRGDFITIEGLVMRSNRDPDDRENTGHHGVYNHGTDNLVTNFDIRMRFIHDLSVSLGSVGNVWSNGRGHDLCMDHHRWAPYQNLFTNLDAGAGTRYWASGGTGTRGKHTAAGAVFWNIRGDRPASIPGEDFGPAEIFFVGVQGLSPDDAHEGWHVEAIEPDKLVPANLHEAQLKRRLEE